MGTISAKRLLLGGIVGGIAAYVADFILNGLVFGRLWQEAIAQGYGKPVTPGALTAEFVVVLATALLGTLAYVLARPRLGGSAKSAVKVSVLVGLLVAVTSGGGMLIWAPTPASLGWAMTLCGFVVPAVGTFVGAWVYKE